MQDIIFYIATIWMTGLVGVSIVLMMRTRSVATRILVLDTITLILVTLLVLFSINTRSYFYMDAALILALLSFVTTLAASRFYGEGNPFA